MRVRARGRERTCSAVARQPRAAARRWSSAGSCSYSARERRRTSAEGMRWKAAPPWGDVGQEAVCVKLCYTVRLCFSCTTHVMEEAATDCHSTINYVYWFVYRSSRTEKRERRPRTARMPARITPLAKVKARMTALESWQSPVRGSTYASFPLASAPSNTMAVGRRKGQQKGCPAPSPLQNPQVHRVATNSSKYLTCWPGAAGLG